MGNRMKQRVSLLVILGLMLPWQSPAMAAENPSAYGEQEENPLQMSAQQIGSLGIETSAVAYRTLTRHLRLPAVVKMNAYRSAVVISRVTAQVIARHKKLGDQVQPGDTLVTLSSVAMARAQGELIVAEREWRRVKKLGEKAVSARRYTEARIRLAQSVAKVSAYGMTRTQVDALMISGDPATAGGEFDLLAPEAGIILQDDFIKGELIDPGRVLFAITDESAVWVEASTLPVNLADIPVGTAARIQTGDGSWLEGEVVQVHHRLDETTRTQAIRIEVPNKDDLLHPGEFVEAEISYGRGPSVLAVPDLAITLVNDATTVFKLEQGYEFQAIAVQTGESAGGWTEIIAGLNKEDLIAIKGVFTLKSLLLKSFIGDEH